MEATEALVRFEPLRSLPTVPDRYRGQHRTLVDFARAATLASWKGLGHGLWCSAGAVACAVMTIGCLTHGGWWIGLIALPFLLLAAVGAWCGFGSARVCARVAVGYRLQAAEIAPLAQEEDEVAGRVDAWNAAAEAWWDGMALPAMSAPVGAKFQRIVVVTRSRLSAQTNELADAALRLADRLPDPTRPKKLPAPRP